MKKLRLASFAVLAVGFAGMLLWRLAFPFPDWSVRLFGFLVLAGMFTAVFSTVRIVMIKK
jgi:hypothetical protein